MSGHFLSDITCEDSAPETVLIFARYAVDAYDPSLYAQHDIPLPERFLSSVAKRQAEYLAGRVIAQRAVVALGASGHVTRGRHGEPVWPNGLRGSISHSAGRVGAWVTRADWQPGLDIEHLVTEPEAKAIRSGVLTEAERAMGLSRGQLTSTFSAKEALFKGVFPSVGKRFGFAAAELAAPPTHNLVTLSLTCDLADGLKAGQKFDIHLRSFKDRVESFFQGPVS